MPDWRYTGNMRIPHVSIIVPTLNEERYLPFLLQSLTVIDAPKEIIVVDGQSSDATARVVEDFKSSFTGASSLNCIVSPVRGISAQRNFGAERASHGIILFLDADMVVPSPDVYEKFISTFEKRRLTLATAIIGPAERDVRASLIYWSGTITQFLWLLVGRAFFSGLCMLVRKDVFKKVGGFNIELRVAEDNDFSDRVSRIARCGLIYVPMYASSRRFKKYGYWRTYRKWLYGGLLAQLGHPDKAQKIPYAFGEFTD